MNGAANSTNGSIAAHDSNHKLHHWRATPPAGIEVALAMAALTAQVSPDWITPYRKWL